MNAHAQPHAARAARDVEMYEEDDTYRAAKDERDFTTITAGLAAVSLSFEGEWYALATSVAAQAPVPAPAPKVPANIKNRGLSLGRKQRLAHEKAARRSIGARSMKSVVRNVVRRVLHAKKHGLSQRRAAKVGGTGKAIKMRFARAVKVHGKGRRVRKIGGSRP